MGDLIKRGYYLNKKTGYYEKRLLVGSKTNKKEKYQDFGKMQCWRQLKKQKQRNRSLINV
jgi:hypothetical protein